MTTTSMVRNLFVSLALSSALMWQTGHAAQDSNREIVGGTVVTDPSSFEYQHTVRLLIGAVTAGDDLPAHLRGLRLSWRCSAAIVAKQVLISAAHCFPKSMGLKDSQSPRVYRAAVKDLKLEAFFKTDPRSDRVSGIRAQKIIVHEGFRDDWASSVSDAWNPEEFIHDIALIQLSEAIPADKKPAALLAAGETRLQDGETLVMSGYGRDLSDDQISLPRLRSVAVPLRETLRNGTEWYAGAGDTTKAGRVDRPAGGCMGDSGGPVFARRGDSARLVGVIVRGPDENNGGCAAAVTISTSLPAYSAWISAKLNELNRLQPE